MGVLYLCLGANDHAAAARLVGFANAFHTVYYTAGGEVGGFYVFHQPFGVDVVVVYVGAYGVHHLR